MKRKIQWVIANGLFCTAAYFGIVAGVKGAENIVIFATWALLFASTAYHTDVAQKILRERERAVPEWFDNLFDLSVILFLIYHSYWFTGCAYMLHWILYTSAMDKTQEK